MKNEDALEQWKEKLNEMNIPYSAFKEPDIENETTAIATYGNGELYRKLRLL